MTVSWIDRFLGDPAVVPLRHIILNLLIVLAVFSQLFFFAVDMAVSFSWFRFAFDLAMFALFAGLGFLVRMRRLYRIGRVLASLAALVYEGTNYFGNGGEEGSSWMVTLVVLVVLALLHEPRAAWWWAAAAVALLGTCLAVEAVRPEWIVPYRTPQDQLFDLSFTFLFCGAMIFPLVLLVMRFYEESNERTRRALAGSAHTEKLAALGETMASLNHEISNPLGIMDLALSTAETWWTRDFPQAFGLLGRLPPGQQEAFWDFLVEGSGPGPSSERRDRVDRTRAFHGRLTSLGWPNPEPWAEQLADSFSGHWNPRWEGWLAGPDGPLLLQGALRFLDMAHSYRTASAAHARLMSLVSSLSRYSRSGARAEGPVPVRLAEGLDLVLALFVGHRNKNVDVVKRYGEVPPVQGRVDELLQVWTNLIKNALAAMNDQGQLVVSLTREGSFAVVTIDDSGPGVPEDLRTKVFEPFFTTKGEGKGTGLGLAVVRRIITDLAGDISVGESPVGGARFVVRLPLAD